ncbi:hypothetical protein D6C84_00532 [Aureobasidium pullulans]|uniref:F-box domain-containing protein n=1 Tax=Aureobasidium pullulans TaxID=5580 RepID=A0A4S9Y9F2_AURPU|nr:hypothetical protein D6C84_00532 [Aureobasidium pullulans]
MSIPPSCPSPSDASIASAEEEFDPNWTYYPLSESFIKDLKSWKQQTISFLDLPRSVRERIYPLNLELYVREGIRYSKRTRKSCEFDIYIGKYVDRDFLSWARNQVDSTPWRGYILRSLYRPLHRKFCEALQSWGKQTVSFLDLPPEIRNRIYSFASEITIDPNDTGDLFSYPHSLFGWSRGALMHSCAQLRREFMPVFVSSLDPVLNLMHCDHQTGLENAVWMERTAPALIAHTRVVLVMLLMNLINDQIGRGTCIARLSVKVLEGGRVAVSKVGGRRLAKEIQKKVAESVQHGSTGLMGYREFRIINELIGKYHPFLGSTRSPRKHSIANLYRAPSSKTLVRQ